MGAKESIKKIFKLIILFFYYLVLIKLPTQPVPGYKLGYFLRRVALRVIAEDCGNQVIVKQGCYIGKGIGLIIGNNSQLGHNAKIDQYVEIGSDVVMGPDVIIMTNHHEFRDINIPIRKQGKMSIEPVKIGNDVWIGTRVIILPGVEIGNHAVIGAGAIITKSVPSGAIVAGNPGKIIGYRQ